MSFSHYFKQKSFKYRSRLRNFRYHIQKADWQELKDYETQRSGHTRLPLLDILSCCWQHGSSFEDYYVLEFYNKSKAERRKYVTLSIYYELERQKNILEKAMILRDKTLFLHHFKALLGRQAWTWEDIQSPSIFNQKPPEKLVFKYRWGVRGYKLYFPKQSFQDWESVRRYMQTLGRPEHFICEEYLKQHPCLAQLNPGTVNTMRVMTWQEKGEVKIWGIILRVGSGSGPDNWAQGGVAAWVDGDGKIRKPSIPKSPFAPKTSVHPTTGQRIQGLQIPHIEAVKQLAIKSALLLPEVQTVGWDIALGETGPCLIEGNDRWSYQMLQQVLGYGCRSWVEAICDLSLVYD